MIPDLSVLTLDSGMTLHAETGAGTYDPTLGGGGIQAYFTDMVLDSDRNAMYAHAILAAVRDFVKTEGRAPVVLDVGCGFGILSLFALVAGAEHVFCADTERGHIDRLPERLPARFLGKYTGVHVDLQKPNPALHFDMLISEILGTFANGESASVYLAEYATQMSRHDSQKVYCVPHKVTQTFRPVALPIKVDQLLADEFAMKYMPTNHVGLLYEYLTPPYSGVQSIVRVDRFDVSPFRVELPSHDLPPGSYVAEWVAELWPGVTLHNTWQFAHSHNADSHSKHARARAWGLMLFQVPTGLTALVRESNVHNTIPGVVLAETGGAYQLNPTRNSSNRLLNYPLYDFSVDIVPTSNTNMHISMFLLATGIPSWVVSLRELYAVTLKPILRLYHENGLYNKPLNSLDYLAVLPFLVVDGVYKITTEFDVPVTLSALSVETALTSGCTFSLSSPQQSTFFAKTPANGDEPA